MFEESLQPCSNCGAQIAESKHMLHELYCSRNCKKCTQCLNFYDLNDVESHQEECQKTVKQNRTTVQQQQQKQQPQVQQQQQFQNQPPQQQKSQPQTKWEQTTTNKPIFDKQTSIQSQQIPSSQPQSRQQKDRETDDLSRQFNRNKIDEPNVPSQRPIFDSQKQLPLKNYKNDQFDYDQQKALPHKADDNQYKNLNLKYDQKYAKQDEVMIRSNQVKKTVEDPNPRKQTPIDYSKKPNYDYMGKNSDEQKQALDYSKKPQDKPQDEFKYVKICNNTNDFFYLQRPQQQQPSSQNYSNKYTAKRDIEIDNKNTYQKETPILSSNPNKGLINRPGTAVAREIQAQMNMGSNYMDLGLTSEEYAQQLSYAENIQNQKSNNQKIQANNTNSYKSQINNPKQPPKNQDYYDDDDLIQFALQESQKQK